MIPTGSTCSWSGAATSTAANRHLCISLPNWLNLIIDIVHLFLDNRSFASGQADSILVEVITFCRHLPGCKVSRRHSYTGSLMVTAHCGNKLDKNTIWDTTIVFNTLTQLLLSLLFCIYFNGILCTFPIKAHLYVNIYISNLYVYQSHWGSWHLLKQTLYNEYQMLSSQPLMLRMKVCCHAVK